MAEKEKVSAKRIADITGVSPSTVSIVINNKADQFRIAVATRERILQTARDLGYEHLTRSRHTKRDFNQKLICAFCPIDFHRGPTFRFFDGFYKYIKSFSPSYNVMLFPYEVGNLQDRAGFISRDFIAGAVMLALGERDSEYLESVRFDVPIVLYNRAADGYCSVLTDDYAAGSRAMSHFIKRGHSKFGVVSPDYSSRAISLRLVGYWDRLRSGSFKPGAPLAVPTVFADDSDAGGFKAMAQILREADRPTALFVPSDNMVSGVVRCIQENGLNVPGDCELISYGDKDINRIIVPRITSFAPPFDEMSFHCARLLHQAITSNTGSDNTKLSFEAECIFRESCPAN
jgi:DNA-binding LacI/PurR family transcriptional regulator